MSNAYKERDLYFVNFDENLKIEEVIVGARCNIKKAELEKLIGTNPKVIELIKARLAFKSFKVIENEKGFQ